MSLAKFRIIHELEIHPTETVAASFFILALLGSLLLVTPWAAGEAQGVGWVDAFFTATSAVCVTGLTVVDTGTRFSLFGQIVIMALIQLGGLGIMTFSIILITLSGRRLSLSGRIIVEQTFLPRAETHIYDLIRIVIGSTLIIEISGALLLYFFRPDDGVFSAFFHAVSAFCNAGFSLYRDNLAGFRDHVGINLVITTLIILGGLGFYVIFESLHRVSGQKHRLSLHTKLVLSLTLFLIVSGTIFFYLIESGNVLRGYPFGTRLLVSYFQSVTARTAGFNTIDFGQVANGTLFFIILLMFVGASPGSTGGGIKTTTLGVLIALAKSKFKGREDVDIFKTSISSRAVARALSVSVLAILIISGAFFLLLLIETGNHPFATVDRHGIEFLFETTSAFGTVGLSTGVTAGLADLSKLLLSMVMLIGRIGPLAMAHAVGRRYGLGKFRYAEESVMIG